MNTKKLPPPAPGAIPVLGHIIDFKTNTLNFFEKNCKTMGPIYSFRLMKRNFYVLNHPDFIKHVLVTNAKNYDRKISYSFLEEMLGQGLLTTEGEEWKKRRRMAQPAFHKEQLEKLLVQMEVSIKTCINRLEQKASDKIDLYSEMNHFAIYVLSNSIIHTNLESKEQLVEQSLLDALTYLAKKRFSPFKVINNLPSKIKRKGKKGIAELKKIVFDIIKARRNSAEFHADLLSMLMAATDEETNAKLTDIELRDEVMTMFIAGHDTTAVALTWAIYLISKHPEVEEKIVKEIKENFKGESLTMADLRNFQYTRMVIQEVMRLYPPVWTFGRKTLKDDEVNGYYFPANTYLTMPSLFVHRNPEFWEKPDDFYPEHFLPEKVKERNKHAYYPFSAGQHLCIGEHYAIMEIQLVLINLLQKYTVKLETKGPVGLQMLVTLKPKETIFVRFEKRK